VCILFIRRSRHEDAQERGVEWKREVVCGGGARGEKMVLETSIMLWDITFFSLFLLSPA
jgi:hypothetical protein